MTEKPRHAEGYVPAQVDLAHRTCRYVATVLGEMMDEVVIAGGLVPSLLIDQESLPAGTMAHVGTMDLDVGLLAVSTRDGKRGLGRNSGVLRVQARCRVSRTRCTTAVTGSHSTTQSSTTALWFSSRLATMKRSGW